MLNNIRYLPFILAAKSAWFWFGIWMLFYLQITDFKGIGLLESTMFFIGFLLEIPTGSLSDTIGKKKVLIGAFLFQGAGNLLMAFANSYEVLFLSVFLLVFGAALFSGTAEAVLFDSLKTANRQNEYSKYWARTTKYGLVILAIASITGGFLYTLEPGLPFLVTAVVQGVAAFATFTLVSEPPVDTVKFSIINYFKQNIGGVKTLFKKREDLPRVTIFILLLATAIPHIVDEVLDMAYAIEIGLDENQLGLLFALTSIIAAIAVHFYPKFLKDKSNLIKIIVFFSIYILTMLLSNLVFLITGIAYLISRAVLMPLISVATSDEINQNIESESRTTALSTFSFLKDLPYVFAAYFIGIAIDTRSPSEVIFFFGLSGLILLIFLGQIRFSTKYTKTKYLEDYVNE